MFRWQTLKNVRTQVRSLLLFHPPPNGVGQKKVLSTVAAPTLGEPSEPVQVGAVEKLAHMAKRRETLRARTIVRWGTLMFLFRRETRVNLPHTGKRRTNLVERALLVGTWNNDGVYETPFIGSATYMCLKSSSS